MKAVRIFLLAIFTVAALAYVNFVLIPQPQTSQARTYDQDNKYLAQEFNCNTGGCSSTKKVVKIGVSESPDCKAGSISDLTGYQGNAEFNIENDDHPYKFHVVWDEYICNDKELNSDGTCTANGTPPKTTDFILGPGDYSTAYSPASSNVCGHIQTDMAFVAYRNTCDTNKNNTNPNCWSEQLSYGLLDNPGAKNGNATYTYCSATCKATPTPTTPVTPTPTTPVTPTVTPTPTVPITPTPSASCYFSPSSLNLNKDEQGNTTLYFSTNALPANNQTATICVSTDGGTPVYYADTAINYSQDPINVDVTAPHTYNAIVYLKNPSDNSHSCSGTTIAACSAQTNVNGTTPTPTQGVTPTTTPQPTNIIINVHQEQQQQQQIVLAATVAPAPTTSQLPSTGGEGVAAIATLLSLLPVGLKLRKII